MTDVRSYERRWGRRALRRPMIFGVAAAVLATGGAVAAVVGTNPSPEREVEVRSAAPVVERERESGAPISVSASPKGPTTTQAAVPSKRPVEDAQGFLTDHTAFIRDAKTGLRLETESYTNNFVVGKAHRITLTLENTGTKPVGFRAAKDCALQAMAFPEGSNSAPAYQAPEDYTGTFEWVCAGSDSDPRAQPFTENFVLRPGERKIADAYLTLKMAGEWKIAGMCRCSYSRMESAASPTPKSDPVADLVQYALPSPLLPQEYEGRDLVTPGIFVRAR